MSAELVTDPKVVIGSELRARGTVIMRRYGDDVSLTIPDNPRGVPGQATVSYPDLCKALDLLTP